MQRTRKHFTNLKHLTTSLLVLATLGLSCPTAWAVPQVLNEVSAGGQAVLIVPNLAKLSDNIAAVAQAIGMSDSEFSDVLGLFKQHSGMTHGLNDQGAMLLVIDDLAAACNGAKPTLTLLMPVEDFGAFVTNLGAAPGIAGQGTVELTLPTGNVGFARLVGAYAVISENEAAVNAYAPAPGPGAAQGIAAKIGQLGNKYLDNADVALYIDIEALGPILAANVDKLVERAIDKARTVPQGSGPPIDLQKLEATLKTHGEAARKFFTDFTGMVIALEINEDALSLTYTLQYKPDSAVAKLLTAGGDGPSQTAKLLAKLPEQPFIFASAMDAGVIDMAGLVQCVIDQMAGKDNGDQNAYASCVAVLEKILPLVTQTKGSASAFYAPDQAAMMTSGLMNVLTVTDVQDGAKYIAANKACLLGLNDLSLSPPATQGAAATQGAPVDGAAPTTLSFTTTYTDNALQLEDVQVDQYSLQTKLPPQMMQQMGPIAPMVMMMGASGTSGYIAAKDNSVIATSTTDLQLLKKGLATIDSGAGIGAAGPISQNRASTMPPGTVIEAYLGFDGMVQTANMFGAMFGVAPIVAPADLAPASLGVGVIDNGLAIRISMSTTTMGFLVDTVNDLQATFGQGGPGQQGGGAGGPGGAPPPPF